MSSISIVRDTRTKLSFVTDAFIQADASGRLPYGQLPEILQRFGIVLTEHDLLSAARDLDYNGEYLTDCRREHAPMSFVLVNDPISARRLVHILVKLGKIVKSKHAAAAAAALHHEDKTTVDERQVTSLSIPIEHAQPVLSFVDLVESMALLAEVQDTDIIL